MISGQYIILGVSAIIFVATLLWPKMIPRVYIIGSIFLPIQAVSMLAGGNGALETTGLIKNHPLTYVLIPSCMIYFSVHRKGIRKTLSEVSGLRGLLFLMILFCTGSMIETLVLRGVSGTPTAFENYIGPFLLFFFLVVYYDEREDLFLPLLRLFLGCVLCAAGYAILEYMLKSNFLFEKLYINLYWYRSFEGDSYRVSTFLGHPLVNATYFLLALIFVPALLKSTMRYLAMIVLIAGIMVTGSRASFIIGLFAVVLFYLLKKDTYLKQLTRVGAVLLFLIVVTFLVFNTPLGQTIVDRFLTAEGSTLVRFISLEYLADAFVHPSLIGNGFGGSGDISYSVFHTNDYGFENPWLLVILDCGIVLGLMYFLIVVYVHWRSVRYGNVRKDMLSRLYFIGLLSCQMMFFMFNSFGTRSSLNYLFWFVAAGVFVHRGRSMPNVATTISVES